MSFEGVVINMEGPNGSTAIVDLNSFNTVDVGGTAALTTASAQLGSASLDPGTGGLRVQNILAIGTGDFTAEGYLRADTNIGTRVAWDNRDGPSGNGWILYALSGEDGLKLYGDGALRVTMATSVNGPNFTYMTVMRKDGVTYLFRAGVVEGSWVDVTDYDSTEISLGQDQADAAQWKTYLDGFRLTIGEAIYPITGFTVDNSEFPTPDICPLITVEPQPQTVAREETFIFSVEATSSGGLLRYQWKKDGVSVVGETSISYTGSGLLSDNAKQITVDVIDDNGTTVSAQALLTVTLNASDPVSFTTIYDKVLHGPQDIYRRGRVALDKPIPNDGSYSHLAILRKTPISQLYEPSGLTPLGNAKSFSSERFEFGLDKITFVFQEIEGHACDCRECVTPTVNLTASTNTPVDGGTVLFTADAGETSRPIYTWTLDDVLIVGATDASYERVFTAAEGTRIVGVTVSNDCSVITAQQEAVVAPTGLPECEPYDCEAFRFDEPATYIDLFFQGSLPADNTNPFDVASINPAILVNGNVGEIAHWVLSSAIVGFSPCDTPEENVAGVIGLQQNPAVLGLEALVPRAGGAMPGFACHLRINVWDTHIIFATQRNVEIIENGVGVIGSVGDSASIHTNASGFVFTNAPGNPGSSPSDASIKDNYGPFVVSGDVSIGAIYSDFSLGYESYFCDTVASVGCTIGDVSVGSSTLIKHSLGRVTDYPTGLSQGAFSFPDTSNFAFLEVDSMNISSFQEITTTFDEDDVMVKFDRNVNTYVPPGYCPT